MHYILNELLPRNFVTFSAWCCYWTCYITNSFNKLFQTWTYSLGRAKIFGATGANVHSIFWGKTWVQKRFQVIYLIFNCARRASKLGCFGGPFRCATARLWSPRGSIKYRRNDLKFCVHSRFAPKNWMHIGTSCPKNFRSAYCLLLTTLNALALTVYLGFNSLSWALLFFKFWGQY